MLAYRAHKAKVALEWASMTHFLLAEVFGFPRRARAGGLFEVEMPATRGAQMVWRPNDFPYWFDDAAIRHDVVWFERGEHTESELGALLREHRPPEVWETAWWVNPVALRSVPELHHIHVLSRPLPPRGPR